MEGIFAIYKPQGLTSNQVLQSIKKALGRKVKIGHAGTLDPLARGVLVIGIGRQYTKKLKSIVGQEKEYLATIRLGMTSTTDDEEGERKVTIFDVIPPRPLLNNIIREFIGKVEQVPPVYSAVKIKGQEAYKRARRGEKIKLKPRKVRIKDIKILDYQYPSLKLKIVCGPGTYIRSLARDIGEKLGTGGYLADLERIRVGKFGAESAHPLDQFLRDIQQKAGNGITLTGAKVKS